MALDNGCEREKERERGINNRDDDCDNLVDFTEKSTIRKSLQNKQKKKMKEKEREIYGDNGCIRCPLEGVPLVIIVTSRNEAQATTTVAAPVRHICIT